MIKNIIPIESQERALTNNQLRDSKKVFEARMITVTIL